MEYTTLSFIFGKAVQVKLVEFFLVNDTGLHQLTAIARELGISHSQVHEKIGELVKARIIVETKINRNRLFEFNSKHPIAKRLKELYSITRAYKVASVD